MVRDRMTSYPVTIDADDTLALAKDKMEERKCKRLPVLHSGKLVGILSEYDVRNYDEQLNSTLVRTAMTGQPITISSFETVELAALLLREHNVGALPVVDGGKLVGIISSKDLFTPEPRPLPEWDPRKRRRV